MRCDKCLTPNFRDGSKYRSYRARDIFEYCLCGFCAKIFHPEPDIEEFLKDDYGNFPILEISKKMIEARKSRAIGQSGWEKKDG